MLLSGQSMSSLKQGIATFAEARFLNKCIPMAIEKLISIFVYSETTDPECLIKDMIEDSTHYNDNPGRSSAIYVFCLIAATFFGAYSLTMKLIQVKASSFDLPGTYLEVMHEFVIGLVSSSTSKSSRDKSRLINAVNKCVGKLTNWSLSCPQNVSNKLNLLQAELAVMNGDESLAMQFYEQSICCAKESKFLHEEALACERAAAYLIEKKKNNDARCYLQRAYEAYFQWGATAKLIHLRNLYPFFIDTFDSFHLSFSQTTSVPLDICISTSTENSSQVSNLQRSSFSSSKRAIKKTRTS